MVVKAAKNLYYHFFIKCGKIIKKKKNGGKAQDTVHFPPFLSF